jgi:sulfate adenylyltransferase large subunit
MDLLRLATAGSVDDGKSTLIGRLLYDAKAVLADQLAHVEERSVDGLDLALLTDGLRAEREQGITIDVAYRSFATPRRRFILADCPGHAQYTRNMVTGASTADLALLLVDARAGLTEQSRRHATIAALLRIKHVIVAVNKMDLVDYAEEAFDDVVRSVLDLGAKVGLHEIEFVPISALNGDNVVEPSANMPWYAGPPLLERLETIPVEPPAVHGARLPVQLVLRGEGGTRWAAGRLAAGSLKAGDEVVVLPSGTRTRIAEVRDADGPAEVVEAPLSVSVRLEDEVDLARGELIATDPPEVRRELAATLCWLGDRPAREGDRVALKHGTRTVPALLDHIGGRVDFETLEWPAAEELRLNDIAHVRLRLGGEIAADAYSQCHATGAFILVDEAGNDTVAAGMIHLSDDVAGARRA